jgi:hypothetical protein
MERLSTGALLNQVDALDWADACDVHIKILLVTTDIITGLWSKFLAVNNRRISPI